MSHTVEHPYQTIVMDIEGTTTPISFVYDVLFPYASSALEAFLQANWAREDVQADIAQVKQDTAQEADAPQLGEPVTLAQALESLRWQMANDKKMTGLKSLQGKIWESGYESGQIKGAIFEDVPKMMRHWHDQGKRLYIYSSGSVHAQKLIFGYSEHGDLRPMLNGYFDTTTGPKKEAQSYATIAQVVGEDPAHMLFLTDNVDEAKAASQAGYHVVVMNRPGNPQPPAHPFAAREDFTTL